MERRSEETHRSQGTGNSYYIMKKFAVALLMLCTVVAVISLLVIQFTSCHILDGTGDCVDRTALNFAFVSGVLGVIMLPIILIALRKNK
jgi:hypothetical protein